MGDSELRLVDIVGARWRHRPLCPLPPPDDGISRWDDLDYEALQELLDEIREMAGRHGVILWE